MFASENINDQRKLFTVILDDRENALMFNLRISLNSAEKYTYKRLTAYKFTYIHDNEYTLYDNYTIEIM